MAAANTIRELLVRLGVDADDKKLQSFDDSIEKAKEHLGALVDIAAKATLAIAAVGAAAIYQATQTGEYAEQIKEQSAALGVSTDAYQELLFIASKYGIESEKITVILSKLAVDQKAIAEGNKDTAATYAKLGLSMDEVAKLSPEQLFERMADGFTNVTDASTRLSIASELFGDRIASQLLPLMAEGSTGIKEMADQAHKLGVVMSEDSVEAADKFNDQVENLGLVLVGVRNEVGLAVIPALTRLGERFLAWYEANHDIIEQKIDYYVGKVGDAFTIAGNAISRVNDIIGGADGWVTLSGVLAALAGAGGVALVVFHFVALGAAVVNAGIALAGVVGSGGLLLAIVGAVVGLLAAVTAVTAAVSTGLLVFQDWLTYLRGGDSVFGRLIAKFRDAPGLLGALARFAEAYGRVWVATFGLISAGWDGFMEEIDPAIEGVKILAGVLISYLGVALDKLAPLLDMVTAGLNTFADVAGTPGAQQVAKGIGGTGGATFTQGGATAGASYGLSKVAGYSLSAGSSGGATAGPITIGGDNVTITSAGLSASEVQQVVDRMGAAKARRTRDALAGREV